ncbi:ABC transporter G family member 31 [Camellia lanceoleosa]|uniref:ABC transporter G family member 31 n=1 Tax=Camellia lanceoleosa TaxID=1840588 RepID=A0ACC0F2M8_9ERIC|nr:ABC transporter G family member 31 [Camellia lanceoleosa]
MKSFSSRNKDIHKCSHFVREIVVALDGTEFFKLEVESGIDSFSRALNAESVKKDEDELLWAALSRLPSQKQTNFALLRQTISKLDGGEERSEAIDIRKLDCFNRKPVVKRALATTEQDNYKLLFAIKERLDR